MLKNILDYLSKFNKDEEGIALTEYLILLGLLTAGVILAVISIGGDLGAFWQSWADWFAGADLDAPSA